MDVREEIVSASCVTRREEGTCPGWHSREEALLAHPRPASQPRDPACPLRLSCPLPEPPLPVALSCPHPRQQLPPGAPASPWVPVSSTNTGQPPGYPQAHGHVWSSSQADDSLKTHKEIPPPCMKILGGRGCPQRKKDTDLVGREWRNTRLPPREWLVGGGDLPGCGQRCSLVSQCSQRTNDKVSVRPEVLPPLYR